MASVRHAVAGVNEPVLERVVRSPFFLSRCASAGLLAVAELAMDEVDVVGGFYGGAAGKDRCTAFAAVVFRLLQLAAVSSSEGGGGGGDAEAGGAAAAAQRFVDEFVAQPHHKYMRLVGIACVRLMVGGTAADRALGRDGGAVLMVRAHRALDVGFADFRRVRVMRADGTVALSTVDQVCDALLFGSDFMGLALPMMPTRRQLAELGCSGVSQLLNLPS